MPSIEINGEIITSSCILCREDGCKAQLRLVQSMPSGYGLEGGIGHVTHALELAAHSLGWTTTRCPKHVPRRQSV